MKKIFLFLCLVLYSCSDYSKKEIQSQIKPKKIERANFTLKKYEANIGMSCAKGANFGETTSTYCVLDFNSDYVLVSYEYETNSSSSQHSFKRQKATKFEKYKYTIDQNYIIIKGFSTFTEIQIRDKELLATKEINGNSAKEIIFR